MDQSGLKLLWDQNRNARVPSPEEWSMQLKAIYANGKGLHEVLAFLHEIRPELDSFLNWMQADAGKHETCDEEVLSPADLDFFKENGYIVLHDAVSLSACEAAITAISNHLGIDLHDPQTWYELQNKNHGLMVPLYQHAALDENRRSLRIRKAFEQLYDTASIHMVVDKVSFNPPVTDHYHFAGSPLHWDASLAQPIPFKLQGLLYLSDCGEQGGAFHCVPGFYKTIGSWLAGLPENADPRALAPDTLSATAIPGKAGDLVIWHQALPHCATANKSKMPRFVQYITYDPDDYQEQEVWI